MSFNDNLKSWIEAAPHFKGCAALIALSDRACTCGKREAMNDLDELQHTVCLRDHV